MSEHCRACAQEETTCICNTCKRDNLLEVPACCEQRHPGRTCPLTECPEYEREEDGNNG